MKDSNQLRVAIVGASGYAGAELAAILIRHPRVELCGLYVSENSVDAGKPISDLYGRLRGVVDLPLQPLPTQFDPSLFAQIDCVFLATAHSVSHDLVPKFLACECQVFDLSGAYRVNQADFYPDYYGFTHQYPELLATAVYGLAEWQQAAIQSAELIALPGCYPTASLSALKPLQQAGLLDDDCTPLIDATSGVTGAGRKAALASNFCEVSLNPYGVGTHRHQPEISAHLGRPVIFTPHLGSFARGILATIHVDLKANVSEADVMNAFQLAYADKPLVRLLPQGVWPSINAVAHTPYIDLNWSKIGQHLIIFSAEDNLLKGASSQAIQCFNLRYGFLSTQALAKESAC
ncbi:N-acetyl-gamma-glutamyl-phosphate reductase [Celerinatantimonas yamalensis]|uniref:N-acetyl-gamma-glutamyl-phosphate reductase n=1 Tax=Celerinatantimonas yamalensis TaxID=559956 RepID=A0ABW9G7W1_9GAMM